MLVVLPNLTLPNLTLRARKTQRLTTPFTTQYITRATRQVYALHKRNKRNSDILVGHTGYTNAFPGALDSPIVSSGAAETAADDAYVFELVAWHTATVTQPRGAVSQSLCCFRNSATVADAPEFSFQLERKGVVFAASSTSTSFVARSRRLLLRAFLPSRFFLLGELQPERPEHNLRAPRPVQVARFPAVCCAADAVDPAADVAAAAHERKVWCGEKEWREKKRDEERENDTLMLAARQRRVELCIYVLRLRLHINFYKNLCGAFRDTQRLRDRLFCRDRKKPFSHAS